MANELTTTTDQADGARAISRLARNPQAWTIDGALRLAGEDPDAALRAAASELTRPLAPVPADGDLRAEWRQAMALRLTKIGEKIMPTMTAEQCRGWREAVIDALSDLPAMAALTAAKRALRTPLNFLSQVDGEVRRQAALIDSERAIGAWRIQTLIDDRATPALSASAASGEQPDFSDAEVRGMSGEMRALGLRCGGLTQEQIDRADAALEAERQAA